MCRVGMTTDLAEREQYWRSVYPHLYNWRVEAYGLTYEQAQALENQIAAQRGCQSAPGGAHVPGYVWSVYSFQY